MAKRDTVHKNK